MSKLTLREARKSAKFTQEDLARAVGVNRATISKYETGEISPTIDQLQKISDILGIPPYELMCYTSDDLIDRYIRGAKVWSSDFRFSEEQRVRISSYLAEYSLRIKELINEMANTQQVNGKIPTTAGLQSKIDSLSIWAANSLNYVNNHYPDNPQIIEDPKE